MRSATSHIHKYVRSRSVHHDRTAYGGHRSGMSRCDDTQTAATIVSTDPSATGSDLRTHTYKVSEAISFPARQMDNTQKCNQTYPGSTVCERPAATRLTFSVSIMRAVRCGPECHRRPTAHECWPPRVRGSVGCNKTGKNKKRPYREE